MEGLDLVLIADVDVGHPNHPNHCRLRLRYSPELFGADTAHRLLEHTELLLESILDLDASRPRPEVDLNLDLWRLPMTSESERAAVAEFSSHESFPLPEACLHDMVEAQAQRTPHDPAVVCGKVELTYSELIGRAKRLADALQAGGVGEETIVGLLLRRTEDIAVAELGVMRAGGAFLPMDTQWPAERVGYVLSDARCRHLLHHGGIALPEDLPSDIVTWTMRPGGVLQVDRRGGSAAKWDVIQLQRPRTRRGSGIFAGEPRGQPGLAQSQRRSSVASGASGTGQQGLRRRSLAHIKRGPTQGRRRSWAPGFHDDLTSREEDAAPKVLAMPRNLAYVIYTSGSTGKLIAFPFGMEPWNGTLEWNTGMY